MKMARVIISIIVPVYRIPERFLRKCIESLISQTLHDIEIILIEDGSPDNCGKICDEYAQKDCRIRVVHKENEGVSVARNIGIREAKGQYITFVDGDDWCDERMCEVTCKFAASNGSDVVFYAACKASNLSERIDLWPEKKKSLSRKEKNALIDVAILPRTFADGMKIAACGKIYKTKVIQGFFEYTSGIGYGEDNIFNLKVFLAPLKFSYCPDVCYYYQNQNPFQSMSRFNEKKYEEVCLLIAELKKIMKVNISQNIERMLRTRKISMVLMNVLPQQFFHPDNTDCFWNKYMKLYYFVCGSDLQRCLRGEIEQGFFSRAQRLAIWAMKHKLWYLLSVVELKWSLQRKMGLWRKK